MAFVMSMPLKSAVSGATQAQALRTVLQADYDQMDAAYDRKDLNTYLSFHTDDYIAYGRDGRILCSGREEDRLQKERSWQAQVFPPGFQFHEVIQSLTVTPGGVIVTVVSGNSLHPDWAQVNRDFWVSRAGHRQIQRRRHGTAPAR